ncbi:MAG: HAMP domain-containing histidine kinase [Gemmataceae bacterium]|nr:HAMP domain-containing histidine kinase [Gemmataceae bacterium]
MPASSLPWRLWRWARALLPPMLLAALVILALREPLSWWLHGEEIYDQEAIKEWVREARVNKSLPELAGEYLELARLVNKTMHESSDPWLAGKIRELGDRMRYKREEIQESLKALGNPPTKMYPGQLPLFPIIYRITVTFDERWNLPEIVWDSELARHAGQYRELPPEPIQDGVAVSVQYHLHAYLQRQSKERQEATRRLWLSGLGIVFALAAIAWIYLTQRRERQRREQELRAQQQLNEAERLRLEEELRRQEAERKHQDSERQNLELKSQMFANIGIMAGSYAHNIKNLLVRPNDLLRRCLEEQPTLTDQSFMLQEVKQTLGTVTERLQQILQTVRRDPSTVERVEIDLSALARDLHQTWAELAAEKWKMSLELDLARGPLWIEGDPSHLQQALENLLFNARDATFEMRNQLREQARRGDGRDSATISKNSEAGLGPEKRQALISAAGWRGKVVLRTRRAGDRAILEVEDNGVGMSDEVRRRSTEAHFSTKRNNALFAGLSAGMGLGLSFVLVILEHHHAQLEIESQPLQGALFRVSFPIRES